MNGLVMLAGHAGVNVVGDKLNKVGPVKVSSNIADGLTNTLVSGQVMIMMRVECQDMDFSKKCE